MDYPNHTTEHRSGKHLKYEDYLIIEIRLKDGWSANRIATKELHCSPNTVRNIIKKEQTPLYRGKVFRFCINFGKASLFQNDQLAFLYITVYSAILGSTAFTQLRRNRLKTVSEILHLPEDSLFLFAGRSPGHHSPENQLVCNPYSRSGCNKFSCNHRED